MTIKYYRGIERDGLVFLCDKEGKELPFQVVATNMTDLPGMLFCVETKAVKDFKACLAADGKVDIRAALVKVPERKPESRDYYSCNDEWNACLDELEGK